MSPIANAGRGHGTPFSFFGWRTPMLRMLVIRTLARTRSCRTQLARSCERMLNAARKRARGWCAARSSKSMGPSSRGARPGSIPVRFRHYLFDHPGSLSVLCTACRSPNLAANTAVVDRCWDPCFSGPWPSSDAVWTVDSYKGMNKIPAFELRWIAALQDELDVINHRADRYASTHLDDAGHPRTCFHPLSRVAGHRPHVPRQEHAAFPRGPLEHGRIVGAREPGILNADDIGLRPSPEQSAHDVVVQILVDG